MELVAWPRLDTKLGSGDGSLPSPSISLETLETFPARGLRERRSHAIALIEDFFSLFKATGLEIEGTPSFRALRIFPALAVVGNPWLGIY